MQGCVGGLLWLGGEPGRCFVSKTALCKGGPGCGQLEQEFDGQGALMEVRWAASHG